MKLETWDNIRLFISSGLCGAAAASGLIHHDYYLLIVAIIAFVMQIVYSYVEYRHKITLIEEWAADTLPRHHAN